MTKSEREVQRKESVSALMELVAVSPEAMRVYVLIKHVSRSGMQRRLVLYVIIDGELRNITWHASNVLGWGLDGRGLKVGGCGMDMCWHTVESLSRALTGYGNRLQCETLS